VLAVNQKRTSSMQPCYRCGGKHSPRQWSSRLLVFILKLA
jgi:hypothetical protein